MKEPRVMRESLRILFWLTTFAVGLSTLAVAQTPAPTSTPGPLVDPFCDESLRVMPWNAAANSPSLVAKSDAVMLALYSQSMEPSTVATNVRLISDTEAYDVLLRQIPLASGWFGSGSPTLIVMLPKQIAIRYAYVDSYARDAGNKVTCPAEPSKVTIYGKPWRLNYPTVSLPRFVATLKQQLSSLSCGRVFTDATVTRAVTPAGLNTNQKRSAQVEVFIDSNGRVVKTLVYKSSGTDYADRRAEAAAQQSAYAPATFLCIPVVGKYLFRVNYEP